jgi:hypothetical protein
MLQWEATGDGLRVIDHADVELEVRAADWRPSDDEATVDRPTDQTVEGSTTELQLPEAYVHAEATDGGFSAELASETGPVELPDGRYLLDVGAGIKTYIQFEGAATLHKSEDFEQLHVAFPERTSVVLGFRSRHEHPAGTVTVPSTPAGVAAGLSYLHSSIKTTGPDRSFPTLRGHPPRLETGEALDVPEGIADATADTGVRIRASPELGDLYVLAPLSFYLQAEVTADAEAGAVIELPGPGVEHELPGTPELQTATADLLRRVFLLDCLVRNVGPYGTDLAEAELLEAAPLDPEWAYEAPPDERLAAYLEVPADLLERGLPDWHLSTYVQPELERARCLPFLLQKLSLVYLPETSELDGPELMQHSLDDFFRGGTVDLDPALPDRATVVDAVAGGDRLTWRGSPADQLDGESDRGPVPGRSQDAVATVDVLKPELRAGRLHGWLAEGVPIDVFKATHAAFENRFDYLERGGDGIEVAVVLNDESMETEHAEVARIYRERASDIPMEVSVHEHLPRSRLAAVFEAENDFVHYIGHCEESGLRCPDGNLGIDDIEESNTQTFFLNACGSYHEGMSLIEKGSVVGGVTFTKVLDKQAATVGSTFARLLVNGFSFARAMQFARRRIMTGKDYAVIGDGTHALTQSKNLDPLDLELAERDDGYELRADIWSAPQGGAFYQVNIGGSVRSHLCGNQSSYEMDRSTLVEYLGRTSSPVLYEGEFYWSTELARELGS